LIADEFDPNDNYDPRSRPWYQKVLTNHSIVWTDPYIFFTSQKPGITIAGPTFDTSGTLAGIVGVDIAIDELSTFINNLKIGKNGRAFMINNNGDVVAFPDLEKIKTSDSNALPAKRLVKIHELDDVLSRKAFSAANLTVKENGRFKLEAPRFARFEHAGQYYDVMLTPFSIKQWPWIIGVHIPENDYLGSLKQNRYFNFLITLAISVVATLIALLFARTIIRPVTNLEKEAKAVKEDDLETHYDTDTVYKEIQETAHTFALMKDAISEVQKKYRDIYDHYQDVYYETTMNGVLLEISPSIEKVTPYKRDDLIGANVNDFYAAPGEREKLIRALKIDGKVRDFEIVLKAEDGTPIYYSLNSILITDRYGKPKKIVGSMRNINARKKAEIELHHYREHLEELVGDRTSELEAANKHLREEMKQRLQTETELGENREKYRNILESIEEGYFETDLRGNFTFFNASAARILGWSKDELLGMNVRKYISRRIARRMLTIFNEVFKTGIPCKALEIEIIRKDKRIKHIELSISLVKGSDGTIRGFQGIGRDITEKKLAAMEKEQLEYQLHQAQRLESIGRLAGGIAHDFNNLLMGIQGNVSLLLMSLDVTDANYEKARNIEGCVQSGADLTRQLLGYARGGKYVVRPSNLNDIIQRSSSLFGRTRKEIKIDGEYQENIWSVEVDRGQIEQVLVNLYLNACQAMGQNGTIHIKTENVTLDETFVRPYEVAAGRYVKVSVADSGVGMDKETQKRVFEPFYSTKPMGRGTGLGLASTFGIMKSHNGIINFVSELGEGTTFYIYLPASDREVEPAQLPTGNAQAGVENILIVDDEPYILEACQSMLTKIGYQVLTANGGEEAVKAFQDSKENFDLVILDMVMPGMDGLKTYELLKNIDPAIKVILASGYSYNELAEDIVNLGCDAYIQKPFTLDRISQLIRDLLDRRV
jgi:PAS domain S-box-containing protein